MEKGALRDEIKQRLAQMNTADRVAKSKQICGRVIESDAFQDASVVMVFLSLPHEVDTTVLILSAWQQGKTVAVPKISWEQRHMIPVEITSLDTGLKTCQRGLRTPANGTPVSFDEIDLIIAPGLGFDRSGNRLGRGGAFYDNFFRHEKISASRWGVAFSNQLYDTIPHGETDVPIDAVVTENEIIICNQN
ncbi:MAG: 5-formyltetrahydrofolate cyclo-ligase [Planctomycetota bacterium]|jgi:5-formyltetrahydrofolate cyclo-ligase